jgi:hypothetical protein
MIRIDVIIGSFIAPHNAKAIRVKWNLGRNLFL